MRFQRLAIQLQQRRPGEFLRHRRRLVERRLRLLIRHLQEEQEGQLLNVVAVRQPVVAKDVAVVPELLDERRSIHKFCVRASSKLGQKLMLNFERISRLRLSVISVSIRKGAPRRRSRFAGQLVH